MRMLVQRCISENEITLSISIYLNDLQYTDNLRTHIAQKKKHVIHGLKSIYRRNFSRKWLQICMRDNINEWVHLKNSRYTHEMILCNSYNYYYFLKNKKGVTLVLFT